MAKWAEMNDSQRIDYLHVELQQVMKIMAGLATAVDGMDARLKALAAAAADKKK
jgi:hypothetical protein